MVGFDSLLFRMGVNGRKKEEIERIKDGNFGTTTISITTLSIKIVSIMTLRIMTFSIIINKM